MYAIVGLAGLFGVPICGALALYHRLKRTGKARRYAGLALISVGLLWLGLRWTPATQTPHAGQAAGASTVPSRPGADNPAGLAQPPRVEPTAATVAPTQPTTVQAETRPSETQKPPAPPEPKNTTSAQVQSPAPSQTSSIYKIVGRESLPPAGSDLWAPLPVSVPREGIPRALNPSDTEAVHVPLTMDGKPNLAAAGKYPGLVPSQPLQNNPVDHSQMVRLAVAQDDLSPGDSLQIETISVPDGTCDYYRLPDWVWFKVIYPPGSPTSAFGEIKSYNAEFANAATWKIPKAVKPGKAVIQVVYVWLVPSGSQSFTVLRYAGWAYFTIK